MNNFNSARERSARILGIAIATGLAGVLSASFGTAAQAGAAAQPQTDSQPQATWNATIARTPVPHEGCFTAHFPSTTWKEVACGTAPAVPYIPRSGSGGGAQTVGNGHDYAAVVSGAMSAAVGSFPTVSGLKTEKDDGVANDYSLQLNSNFISGSPACDGASNPSKCLAWEQFVYASGYDEAFMQYWLINYNTTCPSGWNSYSGDCYKNSKSVNVPLQVITQLKYLMLTGKAVASGNDTLTLTTKSDAYSTTGKDSVVYLVDGWNASEFNVVGDGGGSEADFNSGTSLTVQIDLTDGKTSAPTCASNDGTTGETNNLDLGKCTASGGSTPSISFTESN
jgi:hypothetical protein